MKKFLLASAALASLAIAAPAFAADLPVKAPPPVVPALYNWNGIYIGVQGGAVLGQRSRVQEAGGAEEKGEANDFLDIGHPLHGGFVGGEVGFNWQAPGSRWVFGVEGAGSWAELEESLTCGPDDLANPQPDFHRFCGSRIRDFFEARGRVGYAFGPTGQFLVFVTGGGVWARESERFDNSFTGSFKTSLGPPPVFTPGTTVFGSFEQWANVAGWTVGGGAEWGILPWLTLKAEALFVSLNDHTFNTAGCGIITSTGPANTIGSKTQTSDICDDALRIKHEFVVARMGLNWKFDWGKGKAPVVAKY
jgi:outer membrane immunogenic protein